MRIRLRVLFLSIVSSVMVSLLLVCTVGALSTEQSEVEYVSIFKLMGEGAWAEYKCHISSCEVCSSLEDSSRYKMCPRSFYLSDAAKPMITNDQLRLIALGRLKIVTE